MKKKPTTVKIRNEETAKILRRLKEKTGVAIEFLVEELLRAGLEKKNLHEGLHECKGN